MNITQMKTKRLERYFDKIVKIFPKNSVSITLHNIDINSLDKKIWEWEEQKRDDGVKYFIAKRKNKDDSFDITLFGK